MKDKLSDIYERRKNGLPENWLPFLSKYIKIFAFSFLLPMWVVLLVNEGSALFKVFAWFNLDINFWEGDKYLSMTMIVAWYPLAYLIWFYYETLKKMLLKVYEDFLQIWNPEIADVFAEHLLSYYTKHKDMPNKSGIEGFLITVNKKVESLPKWLRFLVKKLINKIPWLEFTQSFDLKDLENNNQAALSSSIESKITSFELAVIHSLVPFWTKFIIPVNLILLIYYLGL